MKKYLIISVFLFFALTLVSQNNHPPFDKQKITIEKDWLVDPIDAKSEVYQNSEGHLVFSNGLVNRTFTLQPNVATVGLEEMGSNTNYLRSIRPEASVTIDGYQFDVGGLEGQKVHNYFLQEWIPSLTANPSSFKMTSYRVEDTKERFPWLKRLDWMPKDMPWPAPGKELIFTYKLDDEAIVSLLEKSNLDDQRSVIYQDEFSTVSPSWTLFESDSHDRNSFINEGKFGEIMALSNSAVFAERDFQKGTKVITVNINTGTDKSSSWGPGLALVFNDKTIKINTRPCKQRVGFFDGENEKGEIKIDKAQNIWLRLELKDDTVEASASLNGKEWDLVGVSKIESNSVPTKIRVGKMDSKGGNTDFADKGDIGRCIIRSFSALGELPANSDSNSKGRLSYLKDIEVNVHYELYDNLPVFCKWITVKNNSGKEIVVNEFISEILATPEPESSVDPRSRWLYPNITVETDYNFGGMSEETIYSSSIEWKKDPLYSTQVNYEKTSPCLLEVAPKLGPEQAVSIGDTFSSFRAWELLNDSWDRERKGLAYRKMMRSIAPWLTENPILMHVRSSDNASVKKAIDQCAEVGFQMVIMTFGSGFNAENDSPENLSRMKELADYAHSKNIALGGYSLLASRRINAESDVVLPESMTPRFGNSPCIESEWGHKYFEKLYKLFEQTGLDIFEHDGSYPGDFCYSTSHPGHKDERDSQWNQFKRTADFYKWCRGKGIYLNIPDIYFLNGANKTGMGYREDNWSLPRAQQEIIERQNIYDGTWLKTPSMGWMFVPLVEYKGGGAEATIEPLKDHLPHYEQRLANLFGAGVQACYRGPQLYDTPETKAIVEKWVAFYNKHREVLNSDIIHIRRPDGIDYDAILHANPRGKEKGLLMIYNPLNEDIEREISVNLYYTGLKNNAMISEMGGELRSIKIDNNNNAVFKVRIPAKSQTWYVLQ